MKTVSLAPLLLPVCLLLASAAEGRESVRRYPELPCLRDSSVIERMPRGCEYAVLEVRGASDRGKIREGISPNHWELVWGADSTLSEGYCVRASMGAEGVGDIVERHFLRLEAGRFSGEEFSQIGRRELPVKIDVAPEDRGVSLIVELAEDSARVFGGCTSLFPVGSFPLPADGWWGVRSRGKWSPENVVVETVPSAGDGSPLISMEELAALVAKASDPFQRLWSYFDRTNDPAVARPGGKYILATLPDGTGGYDLIYCSGAETNPDAWHPGMRKGYLKPTVFPGHFDLVWLDSAHEEVVTEAFATIDTSGLLTVSFPLYSLQMRFAPATVSYLNTQK